jgi:putative ABC transport system permease protein
VVVDARSGRQVGDQVDVTVRGVPQRFTVSGTGTFAQPLLFVSAPDAQRLGRLTSIGVLVKPGTDVDELAAQLKETVAGKATVLTGEDRGAAEFPAVVSSSELLITLAGVFGGFAVMVVMMVVASTLGLSIRQRRREIALLRAVGTTPRQIRRMVFVEALVISLLATLAAWFPGSLVGRWLFTQLTGKGVVSPLIEFHQGWIPSVVGVGVAVLGSQVAAITAARRAARTRPTEALAEAAVPRKWLTWVRVLLATLAFAGGAALAIITLTVMADRGPLAASTAGPAVILWAVGLTLLAPGATRVVMSVLHWPVRALTSVPGYLALNNARVRRIQLAAAIAPVMLATGFATAQIYTQTTMVDASQREYASALRADSVLQSTTGGFSPKVISQVQALPGITAASEWVTSTGYVDAPYDPELGEDGLVLQGVTGSGADALTAVPVTAGSLADLSGNTVALPARHASAMGLGVGDKITMRFGDGQTASTKIVALLQTKLSYQVAFLPAALLAPHTTAGAPTQIMVRGAVSSFPDAQVLDRAVLTEAHAKDQQTNAWINYLLAGLIILYTAIAVINTLVVETADRRREFGLLRLSGARRGQVVRMAGVEGAVIAITGVLLGAVISAGTLVPLSLAINDSLVPSGPLWIFAVVAGTAGLLTMAATLLPAWLATRARPVDTVAQD